MSKEPYIIGLTGNIATGKSSVAAMLEQLGARVIDADALVHQLTAQGTPTWQSVVDEFGPGILQPDGEISRGRLGEQVFANPEALARLESIVHPAVIAETERLLQAFREETPSAHSLFQVAVLEAIKLIESGMRRRCDELWVVTCPREQRVQRLVERRGLSKAEAELRMEAQPPQEEKVAAANVVIDNSGDLKQTQAQVEREWKRIIQYCGRDTATEGPAQGGSMSTLRQFVEEHPFLSMWAVLAVGMVAIFLVTSRNVGLLAGQRFFMGVACVVLAGLCSWIVSWE